MIHAQGLTKVYSKTVVDDLTFTVRPGVVTGFLGPNGAGKSTTMRMIVGLDRPSAGSVTVGGRSYRDLPAPLQEVGVLLEARSVHTGRTAFNHLTVAGRHPWHPPDPRVETIDLVGLTEVAGKRVGAFSLGMGQRLGDRLGPARRPGHADPGRTGQRPGPRWHPVDPQPAQRTGRRGPHRLRVQPSDERDGADRRASHRHRQGQADRRPADPGLLASASRDTVRVRSPQAQRLAVALAAAGVQHQPAGTDLLEVSGLTAAQIGDRALAEGIAVHELTPRQASLEEAFMQLTNDAVEFHGAAPAAAPTGASR